MGVEAGGGAGDGSAAENRAPRPPRPAMNRDPAFFESLVRDAAAFDPPLPSLVEALSAAREERAAAVRAFVTEARRHSNALHASGGKGTRVVADWTRLMDHLVVGLFAALFGGHTARAEGFGLLALGGFGRSELSPQSDLDLLLLHEGGGALQEIVERLLYPLWDAGLDVQCVARSVADNLEVARSDSRSRTSLLEARPLCGDPQLAERYEREVLWGEIFGRSVRTFVQTKIEEMEERHRRYGDTVYLLEPNVKEGAGGLRDIQTALWVAKVRFKVRSVGELLQKGAVPAGELEALEESREFLLRIRNDLHLACGRREDRLTFEAQDRIAPFFGYADEGGILGVERFLQDFYGSANRVAHFATTVIRRASSGLLPRRAAEKAPPRVVRPGILLRAGELYLRPALVEKNPLILLEAFEAAQIHDADLSPEAMEVIRENLHRVDDRFRRDPRAVEAFLRILANPRRVATTLVRMHDLRFLDRFIPEFGRIFGRIQRDLYHIYPADVHSLFAVQELRRLARGELEGEFPLLTERILSLRRPEILYLAALLHDVGKGEGHSHPERGAEIALTVGERIGLDAEARERLVFLVANHLLLAHTAQGRDLHDEDLILDFARRVGDLEALDMLYLLTFADTRAVGPGAWTSWKDLLCRELYEKAHAVLERGTYGREVAEERVRSVMERLRRAALPSIPEEEVDAFLAHLESPQYLLANPIEALLRHLVLFSRRTREPIVELRHVLGEGYTEVLLLTRDRPGLFAQIAGLMAAHRLNILSAVLNTRLDGWVIDVIHVGGPSGAVVLEEGQWDAWRRDLEAVLRGTATLEESVGTRLRRKPGLRRPRPPARVRVRVDNDASRRFTVVDVAAADRLGLLYDVTRTFAQRGLTIRLAKIATTLDRVSDSFYIEAVGRGKLTDAGEIEGLVRALEQVLGGEVDG